MAAAEMAAVVADAVAVAAARRAAVVGAVAVVVPLAEAAATSCSLVGLLGQDRVGVTIRSCPDPRRHAAEGASRTS